MADIAQIAADLTKAEIEALMAAAECKGGEYWTPMAKALRHRPDLQRGGVLTELGLAVRDYIKENPRG